AEVDGAGIGAVERRRLGRLDMLPPEGDSLLNHHLLELGVSPERVDLRPELPEVGHQIPDLAARQPHAPVDLRQVLERHTIGAGLAPAITRPDADDLDLDAFATAIDEAIWVRSKEAAVAIANEAARQQLHALCFLVPLRDDLLEAVAPLLLRRRRRRLLKAKLLIEHVPGVAAIVEVAQGGHVARADVRGALGDAGVDLPVPHPLRPRR